MLGLLAACEKDDICVEGDTPLLVITFYDIEDPLVEKEVNRLRVVGLGQTEPVDTFSDRSRRDSIGLPLRADQGQTGFILIRNSENDEDGEETGNRDTLFFDYATREVYISRACGFVSNYEDLEAERRADSNIWVDSLIVVNPSVTSSTSAHVSIFH